MLASSYTAGNTSSKRKRDIKRRHTDVLNTSTHDGSSRGVSSVCITSGRLIDAVQQYKKKTPPPGCLFFYLMPGITLRAHIFYGPRACHTIHQWTHSNDIKCNGQLFYSSNQNGSTSVVT